MLTASSRSAAAACAVDRRAGLHLLSLPGAADAVNPPYDAQVAAGPHAAEYQRLHCDSIRRLRTAKSRPRREARRISGERRARRNIGREPSRSSRTPPETPGTRRELRIPTFITTRMPIGLMGLLIAAISPRRCQQRRRAPTRCDGDDHRLLSTPLRQRGHDRHYLFVSRLATIGLGLFACLVAITPRTGSLIEVVNRYGSIFYGSLLGVFMLSILNKRATANGALVGTRHASPSSSPSRLAGTKTSPSSAQSHRRGRCPRRRLSREPVCAGGKGKRQKARAVKALYWMLNGAVNDEMSIVRSGPA